jgi:anaerobic selenocysteine-containing dehydrogenase
MLESMASKDVALGRVPGYCALCVSRCGSVAVVEDGRFVGLEPNPTHPTGQALCAKGRAAPELVYHDERLLHPLRRTRPKGDPDPGWERISWDDALEETAARLRQLAQESGPESVVFSVASPSTSASDDSLVWIERLRRAFGSPNEALSVELCGWGRYLATTYTFGASVPGMYLPDLERAGCILFWGYNPNLARLTHAVATTAALKRGAHLVVVDPRRVGPARKADCWLRVRPGTDAALALGLAHVMIERGWFDRDFVREWTNGPLLVRSDNGHLLACPDAHGGSRRYMAWNEVEDRPVPYDPVSGAYEGATSALALSGERLMETAGGPVSCRPVFELMAERCAAYTHERVEAICGVPADQVVRAARLLWEARPVAYYAWSGVEMQTGATQIARAIAQLYVLTGSFDAPGGNVRFAAAPSEDVSGRELLAPEQRAKTLGLSDRPLGPAAWEFVNTDDVYRAILEARPYRVRGMLGFGANLLMSHADGARGRRALAALDFYVHADLFMNPTADLADIVLPVASAFEREALRVGFEVSPEAQALVQLRPPVVAPRGESRSDTTIVFDLACRLGLGHHFWDGNVDSGYRQQLRPSGISLADLQRNPGGVRAPVETRHRKFAEMENGVPRGFSTPSRKIELYSVSMLEQGYPPLPQYEEPLIGPSTRPDLLDRFPLILTCAKHTLFCESQHRALASLRRLSPDPEVELHPVVAEARGIEAGDWVRIESPNGSVLARARLNDTLAPNVICGQHGWWQACEEIGAPGYEPLGPDGANFNLLIADDVADPVSGSIPHRAYLCEVRRADEPPRLSSRTASP